MPGKTVIIGYYKESWKRQLVNLEAKLIYFCIVTSPKPSSQTSLLQDKRPISVIQ